MKYENKEPPGLNGRKLTESISSKSIISNKV